MLDAMVLVQRVEIWMQPNWLDILAALVVRE